jgi:sulfhydrogenase subunit alpha
MAQREVKVNYMARVEGETALDIAINGNEIENLQLRLYEPPRFFQAFLVGRHFEEVPDLVARICGICPVSHMLTSMEAIEQALGVIPTAETLRLRELLALSQWIQSHTLHTYMLAAPDYLGYPSVIEMAAEHKAVVEQALRLKRLGNDLTALIGGREIHPVTAVIGGFTHVPDMQAVKEMISRLEKAKKDVNEMVDIAGSLPLPQFHRDMEFVSLKGNNQYPVFTGTLASNKGMAASKEEYRQYIQEHQVDHSNALFSSVKDRGSFIVGPLSRINQNYGLLTTDAKQAARRNGLSYPSNNSFASIPARAIETMWALDRCLELLQELTLKADLAFVPTASGTGYGLTEAPRGLLYHFYRINKQGLIEEADIVAPTAHNAYNIEEDLKSLVPESLDLSDEELTLRCEMLVRAYDPCFSCSVHTLRVNLKRG